MPPRRLPWSLVGGALMTTEPRSTTYRHKHPGQGRGHWQASNCDGSGRRPAEWDQRLRITAKGATT